MNNNAAKITWTCAVVLLLMYGVYVVRQTILLFVRSLVFAHLLSPVASIPERRLKLRNRTIALALPSGMLALLGGAAIALRGPILSQAHDLHQQILSNDFRGSLGQVELLGIPLGDKIVSGGVLKRIVAQVGGDEHGSGVWPGVSRAGRDIANFFIVPIWPFHAEGWSAGLPNGNVALLRARWKVGRRSAIGCWWGRSVRTPTC